MARPQPLNVRELHLDPRDDSEPPTPRPFQQLPPIYPHTYGIPLDPLPQMQQPGGQLPQVTIEQLQQLISTERNKRPREDDREIPSSVSESDLQKYDREYGCRAPMRDLVKGLRIPEFIEPSTECWYPHLWTDGVAWTLALRAKINEYSCSIRSWRVKSDLDLDIAVVAELIHRRQTDNTTIVDHRNTCLLVARIMATMLLTTPMAGLAQSEQFLMSVHRMLQHGRVDFEQALLAKINPSSVPPTSETTIVPQPVTVTAPVVPPDSRLRSEVEYWRQAALQAVTAKGAASTTTMHAPKNGSFRPYPSRRRK